MSQTVSNTNLRSSANLLNSNTKARSKGKVQFIRSTQGSRAEERSKSKKGHSSSDEETSA